MQANANRDYRSMEMINQKSSMPFNFDAVFAPPQASEIPPMPRGLVDEHLASLPPRSQRYYRDFSSGWIGRTPNKQQHRTKAIQALAEIRREEAQQKFEESKMENGRKKNSAVMEETIKPLMEKDLSQIGTHYDSAAPHLGNKSTSTVGRRIPLYCTICHRGGHSTQICYHNTDNPKDVLRCYNCGKTGHLAVRCPLVVEDGSTSTSHQRDDAKSKAAKKRRNTTKLSQKKKAAAETEAMKKNTVGLELICKVMADRPLREETEKHNPDLYEEMLTLMLDAITISHS